MRRTAAAMCLIGLGELCSRRIDWYVPVAELIAWADGKDCDCGLHDFGSDGPNMLRGRLRGMRCVSRFDLV